MIELISFKDLSDTLYKGFADVSKIAIVSDSNVAKLYGDDLKEELENLDFDVELLEFVAGEENKRLGTLKDLASQLLKANFDRNSLIVALGGGVTGDLAGFLASVYMRGVKFVQVPTSLLAMVDASIGGKTGVDTEEGKNLLGTFYQPEAIYVVPELLKTLSQEELISGLAEVVKHGLIKDESLLEFVKAEHKAILSGKIDVLEKLVQKAASVKIVIVGVDQKEMGIRKYLNVGHTVGHAIEHLSNYQVKHGMAVSLGIVVESMISKELGYLSESDFGQIVEILELCELPVRLTDKYEAAEMWKVMQLDKKNLAGQVVCALIIKPGQQIEITAIDQSLFTKVWQEFYA